MAATQPAVKSTPGATVGTIIVRVPVNVAASATNGNNTANLSGGGDPACTAATGQACDPTVNVPVAPTITAVKTVSVSPLVVGGSGQFYNITITIANSATTAALTIADTLATGITLSGAPTITGGTSTATLSGCPASGSNTTGCQINSGATVGTIIVRVPVNVAASATNGNNTANLSGGGDPAFATAATGQACDPTVNVPVAPTITAVKTVSVSPLVVGGSGQFYNITITIANSATTAALTIADTLATGITLSGAPTITGGTSTATLSGCPASGSNTTGCQINSGATVGTIIVRVPVNVAASATNGNNTANLSGGGDPACTAATGQACDPTVNVPVAPTITAVKTVSVSPLVVGGSGQFYNITITIANSATTAALTIADTLATGITLSGAPTITGGTSTATLSGCPASGSNTTGCQINSGATVGTIIVRVPVNVAASATNGNNTANLSGGGDPACTAATGQACDPTVPVPVTTPAVSVAKTASPAAGTTVAVGQTITYTLTSTVTNAATTTLSTLTDTLGAGLTFGAIGANPGGYTCTTVGSVVTCTLPIGTPIGSYSVSYTATVNASATTSVSNSVVPTGGPTCTTCTVTNPVSPTITAVKTVSVSPLVVGSSGQFYNITITIANSATTAALTIADTLATGITLSGAPTITGGTSTATLSGCPASGSNTTGCQINSGATVGTIIVRVPVNVAASATNGNNTANLSGGGDPAIRQRPDRLATQPCPCQSAPTVSVAKTASPAAGTTVAVGQTITYTSPAPWPMRPPQRSRP
ncbi:MAG: isopeptide-forming domain-containing fimbrial protein [Rhodoferax sp.]|nr:isopeptide-forming domain-containing fimbrial protein [Rhodoferax sp.]